MGRPLVDQATVVSSRAVWLTVALLALLGLVIIARGNGGPQAIISTLQMQASVHQTQSAAEATTETQLMPLQTQSATEATAHAAQAPLAATVGALETQVPRLQQPSAPPGPSSVLGTPSGGGTP
jgi:hypothetical protein